MGKRILIGLLAVIGGGVLAFVLLQPKKGSIEWHKRELLATRDNRGFANWAGQLWNKIRGQSPDYERRIARTRFHEDALIQLGYLETWQFVVSNRPPRDVMDTIFLTHDLKNPEYWGLYAEYCGMVFEGPNTVRVVGRKGDQAKWEALVRKADIAGAKLPPPFN